MSKKIRLEETIRQMPNVLAEGHLDDMDAGAQSTRDSSDIDLRNMEHWAEWFDERVPTSWIPVSEGHVGSDKMTQDYEWRSRGVVYRLTIERIK